MGGFGSGRQCEKTPVEDCLVLSIMKMQRDKVVAEGIRHVNFWTWKNAVTGEEVASIGTEINTLSNQARYIRLFYTLKRTGESINQDIGLTTSPLPWGGIRWSFYCPYCGRVCRKIYLPPGASRFACRLCYRLTYRSSQEAHQWDSLYRHLAADTGLTPGQVKQALDRQAAGGSP